MSRLIKLITSCFYLGYIPFASGTFGSLFGLGIYFLIYPYRVFYAAVSLLFICLGFLTITPAEKIFGQKDPNQIVIDEASGLLVAFFLIPPKVFYLVIGFLLYRLLDIIKPYPLRKLEKIPGAPGVMLDDLGAAVYTNLILQCLLFLKNI
jgi:phosphatidylglycerophosphatase A